MAIRCRGEKADQLIRLVDLVSEGITEFEEPLRYDYLDDSLPEDYDILDEDMVWLGRGTPFDSLCSCLEEEELYYDRMARYGWPRANGHDDWEEDMY